MSQIKFGELTDWNEGASSSAANDFVNLEEGSNVFRVFTKPFQFWVVW